MTIPSDNFPRQFGAYILREKLASGGMANLFLAETKDQTGRIQHLVIKMLSPHLSLDPKFIKMFTDEAEILSKLVHGNIVPIFDFGSVDSNLFLAMELIDGVDAATLLETCRREGFTLSPAVTVWIGLGTAAALSHAHRHTNSAGESKPIVHRDISPQNVLTSRSGDIRLCDFGIATSELQEDNSDGNVAKGKLHYFSPEQALGKPTDTRSDIFSLGVVLYELICGHHPVPTGNHISVLHTLSGDEGYRSLAEVAPWIPPSLATTIDKALCIDVENRYDTIDEMRSDLLQILHREYEDFSPMELSGLVANVQRALIGGQAQDRNSLIQARLASLATEKSLPGRGPRNKQSAEQKSRGSRWMISTLILALSVIGLILFLNTEKRQVTNNPSDIDNKEQMFTKQEPTIAKNKSDSRGVRPFARVAPTTARASATVPNKTNTEKIQQEPSTAPEEDSQVTPKIPAKKPRFGTLSANAIPWASVRINGIDRGTTPIINLKLRAGRHRAVFTNPELQTKEKKSFLIKPGKTTRLIIEME